MDRIKKINVYLNYWRIIPAYFIILYNRMKEKTVLDMNVWIKRTEQGTNQGQINHIGYILLYKKEFRNLLLNRLHRNLFMYAFVRLCFPPIDSLYIAMPPENIGGGYIYNTVFQQ